MTILLGILSAVMTYRWMLLSTSMMLVVANLGYAMAGVIQSKWLLFFSRLALGLGAGTLSLVRAYFAETYDEALRTSVLAVAAAVQYGGFALFPGVGDLVDLAVAKMNLNLSGLNAYTTPAWLMLFLNAIAVLLLFLFFYDPIVKPLKRFRDLFPFYKPKFPRLPSALLPRSVRRVLGLPLRASNHIEPDSQVELSTFQNHSESPGTTSNDEQSDLDFSSDRTKFNLGLPLSSSSDSPFPDLHDQFTSYPKSDTESETGLSEAEAEQIELDLESPMPTPSKPPSNPARMVQIIWISFLVINFLIRVVLGTIETLGATLYDDVVAKYVVAPATAPSLSSGAFYTILGVVGILIVLALAYFAKQIPDVIAFLASLVSLLLGSLLLTGNLTSMPMAQFVIGTGALYCIGYPLAQSVVVSMFSKIPASARSQSVSMSWIGSAGSVGRIVGPLAAGAIFQSKGSTDTWIFNSVIAAVLLVQALVTLRLMKRLEL